MDPKSGSTRTLGHSLAWCVLASVLACACPAAAHAAAGFSELLTPSGWEPPLPRCSDEEIRRPELMTPEGWGERASADEPNWNGSACSELVTPPDWRRGRVGG